MWIGKDEHHGDMGIIIEVIQDRQSVTKWYNVQWSDGIFGREIHYLDLIALDNVPER